MTRKATVIAPCDFTVMPSCRPSLPNVEQHPQSEGDKSMIPDQNSWRRYRCKVLGAAGVLALVAGCSSSSTSAAGSPSSGATSHGPVKVALVLGLTDNPFMQELAEGSKDAASALGGSLVVTGPPAPDPTVGVTDLNQVVDQGVAGVTIMPLPATLWSKGVRDAAAATKVNIINTLAVQGTAGSGNYVGINDADAARTLLDAVFSHLGPNPSGSIVLGSCIPSVSSLDTRSAAYVSYIHEKLPHVKVIGPFATTTDPAQNLSNWTHIYDAHPGALAYIGNCDNDGPSLARLRQLHPGNYQTATFDIDPASLTGIKNGDLSVAMDEAPYVRGYLATAALILQAQGKPAIQGFVNIKGVLVTKQNVDSIISRESSPASIKAGFASELRAFLAGPRSATGPIVLEPIANAYKGAVQ
jgi:ABC-type sugar transport system substrate-binding protein